MKKIVLLPGDGIGSEVMAVAKEVLTFLNKKHSLSLSLIEKPIGGASYDKFNTPLTDDTLSECKSADAVLLGAVGGYKWDKLDFSLRPERALLKLRKELKLFANLRPVELISGLSSGSPLKEELLTGVDMLIVRELTGDVYFGEPRGIELRAGEKTGFNTMIYSESEIERIVDFAFKLAQNRRHSVCSVDKANVLETSVLWREITEKIATKYPDVKLTHQYVDNAAMQLIKNPKQFDVIVTGNIFGDILSDIASVLTGSIGLMASASLGSKVALYEPIHGSAPDIAGQDKANPLAMVMCLSYMLEYTFNNKDLAKIIKQAVHEVLKTARTADIADKKLPVVSCSKIGQLILNNL